MKVVPPILGWTGELLVQNSYPLDGIIEFKALSKENLQISHPMLDDVNQRLAHNDIHLDVTDKVKEKLVDLRSENGGIVLFVAPFKTILKMPLQITT